MINPGNSHSLTDFQRNARHVLKGLNQTHEPLLLTDNGQIQAVMIDPETFQDFEKFQNQENFIDCLEEGLQDLDEGRTQQLQAAKTELKAKYGL